MSTHLDPDLRQVDLHGELLSAVHVRVVRLLECPLQLVQLGWIFCRYSVDIVDYL